METTFSTGITPTTPFGNTRPNTQDSERDIFMSLLVAQLKNQDPLSPQDGTQFVAQLAQFNSLDQLIGIRNSIERLTALAEQPAPQSFRSPVNLSGIE